MVTRVPARASMWENSRAITPPPMKTSESGSSRISSRSSLVIRCSAPGIAKGRGFEPVAMTILPASRVSPSTSMRWAAPNRACPRTSSMPRFSRLAAKASGTPSTKVRSRAMSLAQSSATVPTSM